MSVRRAGTGTARIEATENELMISGELKESEKTGVIRRRTRRIGKFEYRTTLPSGIDADHIEANLTEGVLSVRVPKSERGKPRRIKIS